TSSSVSDEEGTGIVHAAPGFGEEDFLTCQKNGIEPVCPVSEAGLFTNEIPDFAGRHVFDIEDDVRQHLLEKKILFKEFPIIHRYPHCWRSDTPLIYRLSESWFLSVEPFRNELLKANEQINWFPEHIKKGRFGNWLSQARDWAISRNRVWGNPLPVWRSDDGEIRVMGSRSDLFKYAGNLPDDLHRDKLDEISFVDQGKTFRRIDAVFDCWFESGSVPFAQSHYPFRDIALEEIFPADFIAEGIDQTRGWFYTLHVLSVLLTDRSAFRNVIVNGIILSEDGNKMSKRLKNYPDPEELIRKHGADSLRLYLLRSVAVKSESLCFSEDGVASISRRVVVPFRNALLFFIQHKGEYTVFSRIVDSQHILDRWILSRFALLLNSVSSGLDKYDLFSATDRIPEFVDDLNNWYIRLSRLRFKKDSGSSSLGVLRTVLLQFARLMAPIMPFLSEAINFFVSEGEGYCSVHLTSFPVPMERDPDLERRMEFIREVVQSGHSLRKKIKIRVRQPLKAVILETANEAALLSEYIELIKSELNVKEVIVVAPGKLSFYVVKPNFKLLGKRLGSTVKLVKPILENLPAEEIALLQSNGEISLKVKGDVISVNRDEVSLEQRAFEGNEVQSGVDFSIAFETNLTDDLLREGVVRECVSKINLARKKHGLSQGEPARALVFANKFARESLESEREFLQQSCFLEDIVWVNQEQVFDPIDALEGDSYFMLQLEHSSPSNASSQGLSSSNLFPKRTT
ncbi:class I tRNA ligase family protein, partial [Candidatus Similichlamydia epinepheli]|uniref:class I tRNA ligase family protein n=1 Tax=Candidatus Similichlamydia epinepheli TaxID=1903953 RepID=UPI000D398B54